MLLRRVFLALSLPLLLGGSLQAAPKKTVLLVGSGPDGHPPRTHEYRAGLKVLHKCLQGVPNLEVQVVEAIEPWREGPELMQRVDGVVLFLSEGARWMQHDPKRLQALQKLAAQKGGLVVLHWGMGTKDAKYIDAAVKLLGGCHGGPDRKYAVVETSLSLANPTHPITNGIQPFKIKDEFYYRLKFASPPARVTPLVQATIEGKEETVAWAWRRPDGGRSFGFSGLHFHENWGREEYRRLVAQGVLWTLDLPIPAKGLPVDIRAADLELKK